jgi:signal transduction histidine kinase
MAAVRPAVIAGMLALTGVLTAVLAAEAANAVRSHRLAAERVLHDYASLGAEGVAQRLRNSLATRFNAMLSAASAIQQPARRVPAEIRAMLPEALRDGVSDSATIVRVMRSDSLGKVLIAATAELPSFAYFGLHWIHRDDSRVLMVHQPFRESASSIVAFTLPERDVRAIASKAIASMPVLPPSLNHDSTVNSGLGLRVLTERGEIAARNPDSLTPFRARVALGAPFVDLAVEVMLTERIAPSLVVGGLPRSRVPLLVVLLVMSVALTIAAGDQLRRELALSGLREGFVSSVSHELRTPLAQIRMFAETLRLGRVRNAAEATRSLGIIENEARRLEHLVENLLYFSRGERRALRVHAVPTNLSSLVGEIVSEFTPLAERHGSRVTMNVAAGMRATVDPAALRQAMLNLLDNAVKYGSRGQTITVGVRANGRVAHISIDDQGAGVADSEREAIWDRFSRGEAARRTGVAGTGVGLAIVRDLVALHGGTTRVESAPGGGARIVIEVPGAAVES